MVALSAVLSATLAAAAPAVPAGPQIAYLARDRAESTVELRVASPAGGKPRVVAGGRNARVLPSFVGSPSWSPDGRWIAFAGHGRGRNGIYLVGVADGNLRPIPNTRGGFAPVFAPDGDSIAFARMRFSRMVLPRKPGDLPRIVGYDSATAWTIGVDGKGARRLTPWRPWVEIVPASFAPDGMTLAASERDQSDRVRESVITLSRDGSGRRVISREATAPSFSPDGSRIAMVTHLAAVRPKLGRYGWYRGAITTVSADGSERRRFARTSYFDQPPPSWDPAGEVLAYTEGGSIVVINADGTCRRKILKRSAARVFQGPAWRPGPGRGAGRIAC